MDERFHHRVLIELFNRLFKHAHGTILVRGDEEPLYLPASKQEGRLHHQVVFAHGYFASALHETAHWCIAGKRRRLLTDFGYWYQPDGRSNEQQRAFERVEVKPQALEWIFSQSCGFPFKFSVDNLDGEVGDLGPFKANVHAQVMHYLEHGLPRRADHFATSLREHYGTDLLSPNDFEGAKDTGRGALSGSL